MKKLRIALLFTALLTFALTGQTRAQSNYYFGVTNEVVQAYWNQDGTLGLDYTWDFANQPGAHAIDFVDVGMPNDAFNMDTVSAEVDGQSVQVSTSDYQGNGSGFAVVLGSHAIQPGGQGTVHVVVGQITNVLYEDSQDSTYASAVFAPTYFGSQYVTGSTDLTVVFHLPPAVQANQPRWHTAPSGFPANPETGFDEKDRVTYTWHNSSANVYTQYQFGASFPKSTVPGAIIEQQPTFQLPKIDSSTLTALFYLCCFGFMFVGLPILNAIGGRRRKLQYMAPRISIEGHGIKRGLTAVEAAILMGEPLDKVMTMILFGVIKKNAAEVTSRDPLILAVTSPLPDGLHDYELDFLKAFKEGNEDPERDRLRDMTIRRNQLRDMTVKLVKSVSEKMKGFSRRETLEYYRSIMEKAWQQVEQADTPEVKGQLYDQNLEWTMLDRDYDNRTRRVFTGPVIVPHWWGRYDPIWRGGGSTFAPTASTSVPASGRGSSALPGADFAASVVTGMQTFSSKVIGDVGDFTSRVTNVTNPPPKPSSSGHRGGHGGGHSGGCACACAGCACACAGGGR